VLQIALTSRFFDPDFVPKPRPNIFFHQWYRTDAHKSDPYMVFMEVKILEGEEVPGEGNI
jgi:hypothetical protein